MYGVNMITTISKDELAATMMEVFRELETTGGELIVTENGQAVLRIIPIPTATRPKRNVEEIFGDVQGQVEFFEDINTPTIDEWNEV